MNYPSLTVNATSSGTILEAVAGFDIIIVGYSASSGTSINDTNESLVCYLPASSGTFFKAPITVPDCAGIILNDDVDITIYYVTSRPKQLVNENGGGGVDSAILLEDGTAVLLEDGSELFLESA